MASWIINVSTLHLWLPVEMVPTEPVISLFENQNPFYEFVWGSLLVSLLKGISGCELTCSSPPSSLVSLYHNVIAGQKGSLKDLVWVYPESVSVGDCVCGSYPWIKQWSWTFSLKPSYLPGCVCVLGLTDLCVCTWVHACVLHVTL